MFFDLVIDRYFDSVFCGSNVYFFVEFVCGVYRDGVNGVFIGVRLYFENYFGFVCFFYFKSIINVW